MSNTIRPSAPSHLPGKGASKIKSGNKPSKPSAGKPSTLPNEAMDKIKSGNKPSKPEAGKPAHLPGQGIENIKPGGPNKEGVSLSPELKEAISGGGGSFPAAPGGPVRGGGGSFEAAPGAPKQGGGVVDASKIDDVISNLASNFGR